MWLCFDLIPLKSVHKKECDVLPYKYKAATPWTSLDDWILSCQKGIALHDNSDPAPNSTNLEEPCYSSLSGRAFSFAEHGGDISHLYDSFMNSFLLANGLSCMDTRRSPRPNRPKKDESVLHMMSFSCVLLRVFDFFLHRLEDLFLLHRVGHWWCTYLLLMQLFPWKFLLGRGPGLTLEYTWSFALRSCGTPLPAFLALWNRTSGLPWNLGSDNRITDYVSNCWCL